MIGSLDRSMAPPERMPVIFSIPDLIISLTMNICKSADCAIAFSTVGIMRVCEADVSLYSSSSVNLLKSSLDIADILRFPYWNPLPKASPIIMD